MAGGMPWVKIYTEILDDPKIAKASDVAKWRFVQLILVAAECDAGGAFVVGDDIMTIDDIAWRLRLDKDTLEADIQILLNAGILAMDGKVLEIPNFADRQGPTQKEKREIWKNRQQKRRERVTRESRESHALEKRREEERRGEEDKAGPPPNIFIEKNLVEYQQVFEKDTGIGSYKIDEAIDVWSKMQKDGVTPQDMHIGTQELLHADKTYTIVRPQSVANAAYTAKQNRVFNKNNSTITPATIPKPTKRAVPDPGRPDDPDAYILVDITEATHV